jgi:hypothetical protein
MQLIPFCLFTIICGYSLVISAPVHHAVPDTQEAKQQKATEIAHRLLKELADEQVGSQQKEQTSNSDENKDTIKPVNRPEIEKVETHIEKPSNDVASNDDEDEQDIGFMPTIDELNEIYGDKYAQIPNDEESSSELIDEYILPISKQELLKYLAEQEENDEHITPVIHTPIMADSIMKAENHRRRRRSIY